MQSSNRLPHEYGNRSLISSLLELNSPGVCPTCGIDFLLRPAPQGSPWDKCLDCGQPFWRGDGVLGLTARPKETS
jgi:hypothetical protein